MAYVTGSASSLADLMSAIQTACTSNGWTLGSGILNKGNCHTRLAIVGNDLQVLGGIDNALGSPGPALAWVGATNVAAALAFPLVYHIHVEANPDEVYVFCNSAVTRWQWLAFGCSPAAGLPGTGGWYAASSSANVGRSDVTLSPTNAGGVFNSPGRVLFGQNGSWGSSMPACSYIYHGLDALGWSTQVTGVGVADAWASTQPLLARQPNAWNGETSLMPINVTVARPDAKVSLAAQIGHARYIRNDNLADGELITLGAERWKTYPWVQKNAAVRDGGSSITHSGTFGVAVRYDGP